MYDLQPAEKRSWFKIKPELHLRRQEIGKRERREGQMLGGSFWIALCRNSLGAVLLMAVFLLLDKPRLSMRKTVFCYVIYGFLLVVIFSAWYLFDHTGFIQGAGPLACLAIGLFCGILSSGTLYLSLYKISLGLLFPFLMRIRRRGHCPLVVWREYVGGYFCPLRNGHSDSPFYQKNSARPFWTAWIS